MSTSTATVTPTNIPLTPMRVTYNGVDLGGTTESVSVNIKYELADIMVDQFGKTALNKIVSGQAVSVKLVLAEVKNKDNWKVAFPSATEVTSSTKLNYFDIQTGDSLLARAHTLVLHPLDAQDADLTTDFTFYKAVATEVSELKYGPDKQTGLQVEFVILPDTSASPPRFMIYGDPSIGLVAASASGATFSGTGNGTCTSISVNSGYTRTETITILCLGAPASNKSNWYVSGSVTGPIGDAQITSSSPGGTVNFTSNYINFTLTDGTTDFVANDSFTISTVSANYS
jgi:hypothetical protein